MSECLIVNILSLEDILKNLWMQLKESAAHQIVLAEKEETGPPSVYKDNNKSNVSSQYRIVEKNSYSKQECLIRIS